MKLVTSFILLATCLFLSGNTLSARPSPGDTELKALLDDSRLVVVGKVMTITPAQFDRGRVSEHDPDWYVATVTVTETLKGDKQKEVVIIFPMSKDIAWHESPKLTVGQESIFILDDFKPINPTKIRAGIFYSALNPLQVQPKKYIEKIKDLLKNP